MEQFIVALNKSLGCKNWYGALFIALSLPDICGNFQFPGEPSSEKRYSNWFDIYLKNKYSKPIGPTSEIHEFLSGSDCYALRCAYLHEGLDDITMQKSRKALDKFVFVAPREGFLVHLNQSNSKLQLQTDIFCKNIAEAVEGWYRSLSEEEKGRVNSRLVRINSLDNGLSF